MRYFVEDRENDVEKVEEVAQLLEELVKEGDGLPFPRVDIEFLKDTLEMIGLAKRYYFGPFSDELVAEIEEAKKIYKARWPKGGTRTRFRVRTDFSPLRLKRRSLKWGGRVVLRRQRAYRLIDYAFVLTLLGFCYRILRRARPGAIPKVLRDSAMGVDSLFE